MIPASRRPGARSIARAISSAGGPGATPVRSMPTLMSTTIGISTPRSVATSEARRTWNGSSAQIITSARAMEPCRAFDLSPGHQLVGDQDRWHAAIDHDLGLGHLGAGDPDRARTPSGGGRPTATCGPSNAVASPCRPPRSRPPAGGHSPRTCRGPGASRACRAPPLSSPRRATRSAGFRKARASPLRGSA